MKPVKNCNIKGCDEPVLNPNWIVCNIHIELCRKAGYVALKNIGYKKIYTSRTE